MTDTRRDSLFAKWLNHHAERYYARCSDKNKSPRLSPLEETKGWADAVLLSAERPNWLDGDLSRVAPRKADRRIHERMAIHLAAKAYIRAWDEVVAASELGQQEPRFSLSVADLAVEFERCNQFVCTTRGATIWECVDEGFHQFSSRLDWSNSGSKAHREKGRRLDALIKACSTELVAKEPELGGIGKRSELARRISTCPNFTDDRGQSLLGKDAIRKRLKKMTTAGTLR